MMGNSQRSGQAALRNAVRELRHAQKKSAGVPAYTRYVNRPLGKMAAAVAYTLGLTANQITILSGIVSFLSIAAVATIEPSWGLAAVVTCGLVFGYILDSADGQLARLRGGGSLAGEWLDHVIDAARMPALHLAVLIGLFRFAVDVPDGYLLVPIGYALVTVITFFSAMLVGRMRAQTNDTGDQHTRRDAVVTPDSTLRSLVLLPMDSGTLSLVFLTWGAPRLFVVVYGVLFTVNAGYAALTLTRRYRELANARI